MAKRKKVPAATPSGGTDSQGAGPSTKEKRQLPAANDDLVNLAMEIQESIRAAYRQQEEHRPVMLFDVPGGTTLRLSLRGL